MHCSAQRLVMSMRHVMSTLIYLGARSSAPLCGMHAFRGHGMYWPCLYACTWGGSYQSEAEASIPPPYTFLPRATFHILRNAYMHVYLINSHHCNDILYPSPRRLTKRGKYIRKTPSFTFCAFLHFFMLFMKKCKKVNEGFS